MVKTRGNEAACVVANAAILAGRQMIIRFSGGETGVVTGRAVVHNSGVIEHGGQETRRLVAANAITAGWHMIAGFSCGGIAIVTRPTVAHDTLVIKYRPGKRRWRMAR
jgi:anaerobic glycerol-3-phosphate dehydrogenase